MESQSLSSSAVSTVPSVLENSDQKSRSTGDSYVNYDEEQFESEGDHEQELVVAATASLNSSGSENYRSDEFEDDQEAIATGGCEGTGQNSTDESDYEYESFEHEEPSEVTAVEVHTQNEVAPQESDGVQGGDELSPPWQQGFNPKLGIWCSRAIHELRRKTDRSKLASHQTRVRKTEKVSDKIPASLLQNLIHRASTSHLPHHQHSTSWLRCHQKLKAPASLMQRAQTHLWLVKSSSDITPNDNFAPGTFSTSAPPTVAHTFYSVKCEKLLGQLTTIQLHETTKKWTAPDSGGLSLGTLDFIQTAAAKQREVFFASGSTELPGGRMLHRVAVDACLQLNESIALRRQADSLLSRANIA